MLLHFSMIFPDAACFIIPFLSAGSENIYVLSAGVQVAISAAICSLIFFILGLLFGVIYHRCPKVRCTTCKYKQSLGNSPTPPAASAPIVYEEVSPKMHSLVKSDIELEENVAYGPV